MPILASNGSRSDVQTKINEAVDGDIITLPAGEFTWTEQVVLSGKGVHIQGAGGARMLAGSASAVTVGLGQKTFVLSSVRYNASLASYVAFTPGQTLKIWRLGGHNGLYWDGVTVGHPVWMVGTVVSYSAGSLVMNISSTSDDVGVSHGVWVVATIPQTTLKHNGANGTLFNITEDATHSVEVSGLYFLAAGAFANGSFIQATAAANAQPVLIHDCFFHTSHDCATIPFTRGISCLHWFSNRGVIWNCSFFSDVHSQAPFAFTPFPLALDTSWTTVSTMGTNDTDGKKNSYLEDCDFHSFLNVTDISENARSVTRRCFYNHSGSGSHGKDTGIWGMRHWEIYNNQWNWTASDIPLAWYIMIRGGTGVILDNILPPPPPGTPYVSLGVWALGYNFGSYGAGAQAISNISAANPCVVTTSVAHGLTTGNETRITESNSTPTINGKRVVTVLSPTQFTVAVHVTGAGSTGKSNRVDYPATRQSGFGYVTGLGGVDGEGKYRGDSEPWYVNGNTPADPVIGLNGGGGDATEPDMVEDYLIQNRDYFVGVAKPGYTKKEYPHPLRSAAGVATPQFSPIAGTYALAQTVAISTTTPGASIRHTIDGTTPTNSVGTIYSGPISVPTTRTVKAIAYNGVLPDSTVASATFTIGAAPVVQPATVPGVATTPLTPFQVVATNSPTSFALLAGTLPSGLSLSASGIISGTPAAASTVQVTIQATNASGSGTGVITFAITADPTPPPPVVNPHKKKKLLIRRR